jgi:nitrite reductase/ring-hydroxylating ferredoxin subunit
MKLCNRRSLQFFFQVLNLYGACQILKIEASFVGIAVYQGGTRTCAFSAAYWIHDEVSPPIGRCHLWHQRRQGRRQLRSDSQHVVSSLRATKPNESKNQQDADNDEGRKGVFGFVLNMMPFGSKEPPKPAPKQTEESGFKLKLPFDFLKKEEPPKASITPEEQRKTELRQRAQAERERRRLEIQQQREQERKQDEMRIQAAKQEAERRKNQAKELERREKKRKEELEERRRKIEEASKTNIATSTPAQENQSDRPSWFFWNQTKNGDDSKITPTEEPGKNPLSVAQKFFFGVWDSTVGSLTAPKEEWIFLCPKTRIAPGEIVPVVAAGLDLLVIASKDGRKVHCIANSCPHLGTPLETGTLERRPIEGFKSTTLSTIPTSAAALTPTSDTLQEADVAAMLAVDGCEDCIVCPLHHTAFALESGQVRGEWCPYPPILGSIMGAVKPRTAVAVFDIRTKGKNIEVRINSLLQQTPSDDKT